ncbi:MAG: hypothetical protein VW362_01005 [Candidatus Nanopelagicales bacterium]
MPKKTAKPSLGSIAKLADTRAGKNTIPDGQMRLTVNIPEDLHMQLKLHAVRERRDMSGIVQQLVGDYLRAAK